MLNAMSVQLNRHRRQDIWPVDEGVKPGRSTIGLLSSTRAKMIKTLSMPAHEKGPLRWGTVSEMNGNTESTVPLGKAEGPQRWRAGGNTTDHAQTTSAGQSFLNLNYPLLPFARIDRKRDAEKRPKQDKNELLGSRFFENSKGDFCWQNVLDLKNVSWLVDHVLLGQIVFPLAAYIAMAGESMRQLSKGNLKSYTIKDLSSKSPLILKRDQNPDIRTRLHPIHSAAETGQWYEFQFSSHVEDGWVEHCVGKISPHGEPSSNNLNVPPPRVSLPKNVSPAYWYDVLENAGLNYGPAFRGFNELSTSLTDNEAVASASPYDDPSEYILHPVTIERSLEVLSVAQCRGQGVFLTGLPLISAIEHLTISGGEQSTLRISATIATSGSEFAIGNVLALARNSRPTLSIKGCDLSFVPSNKMKQEEQLLSFTEWNTDPSFCNLNQLLGSFRTKSDFSKILDVLSLLAHKNPKLRILELGNGEDETTRLIHDRLGSQHGGRRFLSYTYAATSLDAAFRLKAALKGTRDVNVVYLDVEQSVQSSSLSAGAYDLIITTNVVSSE